MPGHDVQIKRVYEPSGDADGVRVLIDRIWPRGLTKEAAKVDIWLKAIAPTPELRKWFGHDPARWTQFNSRYRTELDENVAEVDRLRALISSGSVTLLYAARNTTLNNAVVLRDYLHGEQDA
jgi:uncharacterized protein YeaO (DUF488 family)